MFVFIVFPLIILYMLILCLYITGTVSDDTIVARKAVVESFGAANDIAFSESNVLLKTHCLCVAPPVTEFLENMEDYQGALRDAVRFFENLNGKRFEGKILQVSVVVEPTLSEAEAQLWNELWDQMMKKKRY
jgi:hypothetical protein